jgi:GTP pyrophosphokinase
MLDKAIRPFGLGFNKLERSGEMLKAAQTLGYRSVDELSIAVGYGRIDPEQTLPHLVPREALERRAAAAAAGQGLDQAKAAEDQSFLKKIFNSARRRSEARNAITVANLDDVLIRFGRCCAPLPGDSIVGFITRGRGVTIHTSSCAKALDSDQERRVDVQWNIQAKDKESIKRHVKIRVVSLDEPGLLALMSQTISACGVNIASANIRTTKEKKAIALFDVEVHDLRQLNKVQSALESKKGVITVERLRS